MDIDKIPETRWSRAFRRFFERRGEALGLGEARGEARGEAKGKREAVLAVLAARGLPPTEQERAMISALTDLAALDRCIQAAVAADSVSAVLAAAEPSRRRRAARARAPTTRTRNRSRRR